MELISKTPKPDRLDGRLLLDSIVMFGANGLGSAIGFAFHLAVARVGGPTVYADLGALMSLSFLMSVIAVTIQTYVAARVARLVSVDGPVRLYLGRTVRKAALAGIPAALVFVLIAPWASRFFGLLQKSGVIVVGAVMIPLLVLSVLRGGLQGTQRFAGLGCLRMIEPAVQLAAGVGLVAAGLGAAGAISGTALGIVLSMATGLMLLKPAFQKTESIGVARPEEGVWYVTQIALFLSFVSSLTNLDVLLVKHYFIHEETAQYVAASFMSRILFLSAASIGFALFPKTAAIRPGMGRPLLIKSLLYYLAFAVPFIGFCSIFPDWVVGLFYGDAYEPAARLLPRMLAAYGLIGAAYLIGNYRISRNRRRVWISFCIPSVLQAILIAAWPVSPLRVSVYMIACSAVLIGLALIPMGSGKRKADNGRKDD